jgi:sugar lactone lactonase YvrE
MHHGHHDKWRFTTIGIALIVASLVGISAQNDPLPINDLPNPYKTVAPWGTLPAGRTWGALSAVTIDRDGESIWVADRCGSNPDRPPDASPFQYDSCAYSTLPPILKFDASGRLLRSFGAGMFVFPHKIYMDLDGNLWVADQRGANERESAKSPAAQNKGHIVVKFSPDGKVLLRLGTPGVPGNPPAALTEPTSIVMAPNGTVYISEGHQQGENAPPTTVARISMFTKDGKYIRSFGTLGSGPGEFRGPHDLAMDAQGRLFVADRGNMRVQILDQDGRYITEWKQFSRPSGVYIRNDLIYVADSESNGVAPHPGWKRGIRIGSVKDGKVTTFIPDPQELKGTSSAEGLAVDGRGNIYGAEVGQQRVARHSRQ